MKKFFMKLCKRIVCLFKGHSHPMFNCFHCGARSPLEFRRDEKGECIRDEKGNPILDWIGWGW